MGRWWLVVVLSSCGMKPPDPEPSRVARLELSCPRHSVAAYDATRTLLVGPSMSCTARVSDVAGAPLAGVQVHLLAEAGRLTGGRSNDEGVIEVTHEVALPTPLDVEPADARFPLPSDVQHTGQPLVPPWMHSEGWGGPKSYPLIGNQMVGREPSRPDPIRLSASGRLINNPRDNLVTLIAWADGAEPLDDTNGNGQQDPGESFTDLTEPFVDANDDGTWNQGEAFVDTNGNRQWDGKNLIWDQTTKLWVQERVLWTGLPASQDVQLTVPGVTGHRATFFARAPNLVCSFATVDCASALNADGTPGVIYFTMSDPWFNAMARTSEANGCVVVPIGDPTLVTYGTVTTNLDGSNDAPDGMWGSVIVTDTRNPNSPSTNRPRAAPPIGYRGMFVCQVSDGSPSGDIPAVMSFEATIE